MVLPSGIRDQGEAAAGALLPSPRDAACEVLSLYTEKACLASPLSLSSMLLKAIALWTGGGRGKQSWGCGRARTLGFQLSSSEARDQERDSMVREG